jgi:hypothetical protein
LLGPFRPKAIPVLLAELAMPAEERSFAGPAGLVGAVHLIAFPATEPIYGRSEDARQPEGGFVRPGPRARVSPPGSPSPAGPSPCLYVYCNSVNRSLCWTLSEPTQAGPGRCPAKSHAPRACRLLAEQRASCSPRRSAATRPLRLGAVHCGAVHRAAYYHGLVVAHCTACFEAPD